MLGNRTWLATGVGIVLLAAPVFGQEADKDQRIAELVKQVATLKQQVAEQETLIAQLRKQLASSAPDGKAAPNVPAAVEAARVASRARMQQDTKKYSREQLGQAEQLYQVANKNWRSLEAKASLEKMIQQFPDINRTGCAVLYMGQMSEGAEREKYLQQAIDKYSDCYYGDGANVGAYARFVLGTTYLQAGQKDKAKELFDQIRKDSPQALDHKGRLLVTQLPGGAE